MAEIVACLTRGKVVLLQPGLEQRLLVSPYATELAARTPAMPAPFVDVTRGRRSDELCYAIGRPGTSAVFTQIPGTGEERRLFIAEAEIRDLDFSFADEALACSVINQDGTSAIGLLADDGKGMRTITEGDVLDREPRWAPGGRGEIVYASAGVGRTKSGAWAGLAPFSLHRLKIADSTVEVLVSDARYDYLAPVAASNVLIYAIRRAHRAPTQQSTFGLIAQRLSSVFRKAEPKALRPDQMRVSGSSVDIGTSDVEEARAPGGGRLGYELVRITERRMEVVAQGVLAFDVSQAGDILYSSGNGVFRMPAAAASQAERISDLTHVEQLVVC
jgi:hypothetical protein